MGFATPPSATGVGTLVDEPPAAATLAPGAASPTAAPTPDDSNWPLWAGLGALALAVVLVGGVVALVLRRRARR
jgi:hypothetical protein